MLEPMKSLARQAGVVVVPSRHPGKKLDAYRRGKYLCSFGENGREDYWTLRVLESKGLLPRGTAGKKRREYHRHHRCSALKRFDCAWLACRVLW